MPGRLRKTTNHYHTMHGLLTKQKVEKCIGGGGQCIKVTKQLRGTWIGTVSKWINSRKSFKNAHPLV